MKRKLLCLVALVLVALMVLAACAPAQTAGKPAEGKKLRVFFTNPYYNSPYCVPLNATAKKVAEESNVDLTIVDGEQSGQKQLDQINTAINEKYDGIIYFPADVASSVKITQVLSQSKVPFVTINCQVDPSVRDLVPAHAGTQEITHGYNIGDAIKKILGDKGGNVVEVEGAAGSSFTIAVTKGIKEKIEGTNIKLLATQQADFDAQKAMKVMEDYITKYRDQIDLVVSQDGGMLPGVLSALDAAGLKGKIPVVAAGSNKVIKDALLDGSLYSTSTQDPGLEASLALQLIVKVIKGEKVEKFNQIPMEVCTKADIDKYNWF